MWSATGTFLKTGIRGVNCGVHSASEERDLLLSTSARSRCQMVHGHRGTWPGMSGSRSARLFCEPHQVARLSERRVDPFPTTKPFPFTSMQPLILADSPLAPSWSRDAAGFVISVHVFACRLRLAWLDSDQSVRRGRAYTSNVRIAWTHSSVRRGSRVQRRNEQAHTLARQKRMFFNAMLFSCSALLVQHISMKSPRTFVG